MAPRTDLQNQTIREESRQRLIEAALRLFAREGYDRTSVRMIAQEAQVSQGLLYNYFQSKQDLLHAIFLQSMQDVQQSFATSSGDVSPEQQLAHLIRSSFEIVRRNLQFWRLSYSLRMQPDVLADLGEQTQDWSGQIMETLEGRLRATGSHRPETEARVLFALIDGVAQHYALDPENYPLEAVGDEIVTRYCGGTHD